MTSPLAQAFLGLTLAAALALGASPADAGPSPEAHRLMRSRTAELYTVAVPRVSMKAGGSRVHIAAPLEDAKRIATDWGHYAQMVKQFEQSRIVGKQGNRTDVYMRVPILKGAAKIWVVMRFEAPRKVSPDEYVVTGKMVRGNVKRFDATYRIRRIDDGNTQLNLEMLIVPRIPAPSSAVAAEVSKAARSAVRQLRNATEARGTR